MAAVAIVATAVTAQHVAAIQTMCVVQIQVLIAALQVTLAVKGVVVTLLPRPVAPEAVVVQASVVMLVFA